MTWPACCACVPWDISRRLGWASLLRRQLTDYPPMLVEKRNFVFGAAAWLYEAKFDGHPR